MENDYFITEDNVGMLKLAKEANTILVRKSFQYSQYIILITIFFFLILFWNSSITGFL